ncbi:serine hydrolase domain-containing protein [Mucilaginibacter sp. CSA2-8R]|uniref:serine hydrolase domain-containing protein n=1 Tax=Mucilaginibacter sp. CSA2-8R TaxID=3141542 RepID=UPI00315DB489
MTVKPFHILLIAFVALAQTSLAQTFNKAKMDSLFDAVAANNRAMLSVALTQKGQLVYSRAIGNSWLGEKNIPATIQTKYRIGSISKVFTAVMIFQLVEEGKLQLTTPLSEFYPSLPNASKITIAQLLSHSSGLHSFTSDSSYLTWLNKKMIPAEMIAKINVKPDFEPGSKHQYSNSNFILLGYIIEKLDKKPYALALKNRITSKTGLSNTYYGGKITAANNEAYSYYWKDKWLPDTETDMSIPGGAGALVSNPTDLVKFMNALFNSKLVSTASLTQMRTINDGYGMNLFAYPFDGHTAYGHGGDIDGFHSQAAYFPADDIAVAYTANGVNMNLNNMMIGVLSIAFNKAYTIPNFKPVASSAQELDQYIGIYSSTQIPIKITIGKNETTLTAQATGQSAFSLDAAGNRTFKFDAAGITLIFDPANGQMTLKQGGRTYLLTKAK